MPNATRTLKEPCCLRALVSNSAALPIRSRRQCSAPVTKACAVQERASQAGGAAHHHGREASRRRARAPALGGAALINCRTRLQAAAAGVPGRQLAAAQKGRGAHGARPRRVWKCWGVATAGGARGCGAKGACGSAVLRRRVFAWQPRAARSTYVHLKGTAWPYPRRRTCHPGPRAAGAGRRKTRLRRFGQSQIASAKGGDRPGFCKPVKQGHGVCIFEPERWRARARAGGAARGRFGGAGHARVSHMRGPARAASLDSSGCARRAGRAF